MVFTLDTSPAEERLLRSYCGGARKAYNWAIAEVRANLAVRASERAAGVPQHQLTPSLSWSAFSLSKRWNAVKVVEAPWWREVSMHAFRSGLTAASEALSGWYESTTGKRKGRTEFPRFKSKKQAPLSVSFVEINHQLSWLHADRHGVRLMLPKSSPDPEFGRHRAHLGWLHTVESTGRLYRVIEAGQATIQKVTIFYRGGRWRASFQVRYSMVPETQVTTAPGDLVGIDLGLRHLAILSQPVVGLTDNEGHIPNPRVLEQHIHRLRKADRQLARAQRGSKSWTRAKRRQARIHGRIAQTRALYLHRLTKVLARSFAVIALEDLNVAGMANRKRRLGRRVADAGLSQFRQQVSYKAAAYGHQVVAVGRFYPSSKTCSSCGAVKAKLPLGVGVFACDSCGLNLDRDVNAARTIAEEARRLLAPLPGNLDNQQDGAGIRPESENAAPRPQKTSEAPADLAAVA